MKILVADDNTNIQKMVVLAFQERGIEVIAVGNGEAAVRRIPDANPDLVLADVFMPAGPTSIGFMKAFADLGGHRQGIKLPSTVEANNWYLGFNWWDPVVGRGDTPEQQRRNRLLRHAISIAIDWEEGYGRIFRDQGGDAATSQGKIYAVPALVDNLALVYNKKLFEQAGVGLSDGAEFGLGKQLKQFRLRPDQS